MTDEQVRQAIIDAIDFGRINPRVTKEQVEDYLREVMRRAEEKQCH